MENIQYTISECSENDLKNYDNNNSSVSDEIDKQSDDLKYALETNYNLNYTFNNIKSFLDYYKISYKKLNKINSIKILVDYEINNIESYNERKRLFNNYIELKNNEYFRKFIIANI
tara:strand:+ start:941 stop:1288 length:348 start_codon:yes stop_codon:yes gene_type:complete